MQVIQQGARGTAVMFLQAMLNKRGASPRLGVDGDFGPRTKTATEAFQRAQGVMPHNGVVTGSTWIKFGRIIEHIHTARMQAQPNGMTCWSAAATMMTGNNMSVGPGGATTIAPGTDPSLTALDPSLANIEVFARGMGWRVFTNMSMPGPSQLIAPLARGPIWVVYQGHGFAHAVMFNGVISDGDESGDGTVFSVYDPWPPGRGTVYSSPYAGRLIVVRSSPARPTAMIAAAAS